MRSIKQAMRTVLLVSGSVLVALGYPLAALAEDGTTATTAPSTTTTATAPTDTTTTTPTTSPDTTSTTTPAASDETQSPTTTTSTATTNPQTTTTPQPTYTYDSTTQHWNTNEWTYDPASGTYVPTPQPVVPETTSSSTPTGGAVLNDTTTTAIANALNSTAKSGDASVLSNTLGGSATTGDASSVATVINNVNSSLTNSSNQQAANFVSNIMGDVNGDIMLQPMLLKAMLEAQARPMDSTTLNSATNTNVTNDINLGATSGNATVASNTEAGSATSGSANTVANVVNLVNSLVAAHQSFTGTINIYGNLNGDILIAPDFIPQLLESNGGSSSSSTPVGTASITSTDNQSIVNNISLAAKTGQALVSGNTSGGNATSGSATTNAVIFNLTNHEIVASNSLLVFVNVLGRWVGVIVDAPAGATAAAIGNNVTENNVTPNLVIDATNTTQLTNNINLSSQSGDATVTRNTSAGNATSGDASASANVANISGSQLGLSGWFGVLFINVFGSWIGSFGIDTAAGNPLATPSPIQEMMDQGTSPSGTVHVMEFIPHPIRRQAATVVQGAAVTPPSNGATEQSINQTTPGSTQKAAPTKQNGNTSVAEMPVVRHGAAPLDAVNLPMLAGSLVLLGGSLLGLRRISKLTPAV